MEWFRTDTPVGIWWQLRNFDLRERMELNRQWWNDNINRGPKGIALLQYTLRGAMLYRDRHGQKQVPAGWAALCLSGEHSSYGRDPNSTEAYETFWLSFSGAGIPEHWNDIRERFGSIVHLGERSSVLDRAKALCRMKRPRNMLESAQRSSDVHAFFRTLYSFLENSTRSENTSVALAVKEMLDFTGGSLSVKEVAARHGISREHLSRVFTHEQGMPPARYLARARLNRATSLLLETSLPVATVAQQSGFGTKQALVRWMKHELGCLPNQFRRARHSTANYLHA